MTSVRALPAWLCCLLLLGALAPEVGATELGAAEAKAGAGGQQTAAELPDPASQPVGHVERSSGEVLLQRGGASAAATVGDAVRMGDKISAGPTGRARIVFVDATVLSVSPGTEVEIGEMVYGPERGRYSSSLDLVAGEVRTTVGETYDDGVSSFALQSPTARVDVGASDLLMSYSVDTETTEITTFSGAVRVSSIVDLIERKVVLQPGHRVSVFANRPPSDPRPLLRREFGQFLEGVDLSVSVARELVMAGRLLGKGSAVTPAAAAKAAAASHDASDILDGSPTANHITSIGIGF